MRLDRLEAPQDPVVLGVDIGTSSTKGVLATPDGAIVGIATRQHGVATPRPGWAEHDPELVWWREFVEVVRELVASSPGHDVVAVGLSGMGPCFLPCRPDGSPLRAAILYSIDNRAAREVADLTERFGMAELVQRCGSPLTSQSVGPKMLWVRRHEPDVWAATRRWFMAGSYLVNRLTGQYVLDHFSASMVAPLYDIKTRSWIEGWCEEVAPGLDWPVLRWPGDIAGTVTAAASRLTGIPLGTPVIAGTVDSLAEACSVGVADPGDAMMMYGTTMLLMEVLGTDTGELATHGTVGLYPGATDATLNLSGAVTAAGAITNWLHRLTQAPHKVLIQEALMAGVGAKGLLILPYFSGVRNPMFDPNARGLVLGLTTEHGRGDLYRAALEGAAFGARHILESMRHRGAVGQRFVAVGGGTHGGLWPQIVSDVLGVHQHIPMHTIGASFGDALLACRSIGLANKPQEWNPIISTITPNEETRYVYDRLYASYKRLYIRTMDDAHMLAEMQAS